MAYPRTRRSSARRTTGRSRTYTARTRAPSRGRARSSGRRASTGRRSGGQTIKLVIETQPSSAISRPHPLQRMLNPAAVETKGPTKAKL